MRLKWRLILYLIPFLALAAFAGYYSSWNRYYCEKPTVHTPPREGWLDYTGRDGRREAEADLARGEVRLLDYGLPAPWFVEYRTILRNEYGVESHTIAGCDVYDGVLRYANAYNDVMERHIVAQYGTDVFDRVSARARDRYRQTHVKFTPPQSRLAGQPPFSEH